MQQKAQHTKGFLRFEEPYTALTWITVECLTKKRIKRIVNAVKSIVDQSSVDFFGCSFGRYDLIVEFQSESPRVASWRAVQIRNQLKVMNRNRGDSSRPISCSLSLCRKITTRSTPSANGGSKTPLVAYVFMKPETNLDQEELTKLLRLIDSRAYMDLFWNSSSYNLLLAIRGSCYYDMFSDLIQITEKFPQCTTETCTFFAVRWESEADDFCRDLPKHNSEIVEIPAITNVKLKDRPDPKFKIKYGDWVPLFGSDSYQFRRLGWLDVCLFAQKDTLRGLLQSLNVFREDNRRSIKYTSTVLLSPLRK